MPPSVPVVTTNGLEKLAVVPNSEVLLSGPVAVAVTVWPLIKAVGRLNVAVKL